MKITLTPRAYWHLQWLCQRTPSEVSCMGVFADHSDILRVTDVVLVKQTVSSAHVDLDMVWWADKQVALYEQYGIEPWQASLWIHTHPSGLATPSATDERTMEESFGSWDFAIMLILTKDGTFYARVDFNHEVPGGCKQRFQAKAAVEIEWTSKAVSPVTQADLDCWDEEFRELVAEEPNNFSFSFENKPSRRQRSKKKAADEDNTQEEEVMEYGDLCELYGLDPDEPESYEALYGCWPGELAFESPQPTGAD